VSEVPRGRTTIADFTITLRVGDEAPDFKLPSHNGDDISLSQFRGKNVVVQFMSLAFTSV
jgi:peroxiredoxin